MTETIKMTKTNGNTGKETKLKDKQITNREKFIKNYFKNKKYSAFNIEYLDFIENKRNNLEIYVKKGEQVTIYFIAA